MYFLKGTPFIYQGQEIGMTNLNVDSLEDFVDLETHNVLALMRKLPLSKKYIDKSIRNGSRDNSRTPMQWDNSTNAGFSSSTPWLMVNNNYQAINVEKSVKDDNSILNYYKKLLKIYKKYSTLVREGEYKDLYPNSSKLFAYERRLDNERLLVVSNFSNKPKKIRLLKKYKGYRPELLLNNYKHLDEKELKPYQTILIHLKKK